LRTAIHYYQKNYSMPPSIWLVTGTSSGFGEEFVKQITARGDKVIATARNLDKVRHLKDTGAAFLQLDVTASQDELNRKVKEAIGIYGRIDVLVNNAGYVGVGTLEEVG
jgi:NADP-dependent 3-hydroxy acid dehydrogenase YdfG